MGPVSLNPFRNETNWEKEGWSRSQGYCIFLLSVLSVSYLKNNTCQNLIILDNKNEGAFRILETILTKQRPPMLHFFFSLNMKTYPFLGMFEVLTKNCKAIENES